MQQLQPVFLVALTSCLVALSWERDDYYDEDEDEDTEAPDSTLPDINGTEIGQYLGSPCEVACNPRLPHVVCNRESRTCECDKKYPVRIGPRAGCGKPLRLGDQCFYERTCSFTDQHASCIQVNHNALCQCKPGYHTVSLQRPTKRVFCSEDLVLLTTDVPTLLGVASGLAVFTFLICFVLKLFSRARFARPRHFANANLAPPILFSSETVRQSTARLGSQLPLDVRSLLRKDLASNPSVSHPQASLWLCTTTTITKGRRRGPPASEAAPRPEGAACREGACPEGLLPQPCSFRPRHPVQVRPVRRPSYLSLATFRQQQPPSGPEPTSNSPMRRTRHAVINPELQSKALRARTGAAHGRGRSRRSPRRLKTRPKSPRRCPRRRGRRTLPRRRRPRALSEPQDCDVHRRTPAGPGRGQGGQPPHDGFHFCCVNICRCGGVHVSATPKGIVYRKESSARRDRARDCRTVVICGRASLKEEIVEWRTYFGYIN